MNQKTCLIIGLLFSFLSIVIGIVILVVAPAVIDEMTRNNIVLSNKGIGYDFWKEPPFPIKMQFWVWNLTNPSEVMMGDRPKLEQIGPYTYSGNEKPMLLYHDGMGIWVCVCGTTEMLFRWRYNGETRPKALIKFGEDNGTVSYISPQTYVLDLNESVGDPKEDNFTTINVPYITAVNQASYWGLFDRVGVQLIAKHTHSKVFDSYRVYDFIWGYNDSLLLELRKLKPDAVPTAFFGLFADRNNSHDGVYVVNTGRQDSSQTNIIQTFRGMKFLPYWSTAEANMINGTDGTYNPPFLDKRLPGYVFSSDICRSIKSEYEMDTTLQGITAYRYIGPPSDFESGQKNPDNLGFCTPDASHCLPGGLLNVSNCQKNAPVVMSLPHFLYTDPLVLEMIAEGLSPNKEEHQTFFDIEPQTGAPLRINKRLQINVHVKKYKRFLDWKHLPEVYLPTVWVNESTCITDEHGGEFRWLTVYPKLIATIVGWALIGIGIITIMLGVCLYFWKEGRMKTSNTTVINDAEEESPTERTHLLSNNS